MAESHRDVNGNFHITFGAAELIAMDIREAHSLIVENLAKMYLEAHSSELLAKVDKDIVLNLLNKKIGSEGAKEAKDYYR